MLALKNFIQFGVDWKSQDELDPEGDVRFINSRAAKVILRSLADLTKVKSPKKGVKTGREGLSGFVYQRSTVSDVLKRLKALGIIERRRGKNKGSIHEDFATTYVVQTILNEALAWQKECRILKKMGKRGDEAKPVKKILIIPLKSTEPSGEPINTRVTEEQLPENGNTSYQKLDTMTVFTPPSLPEPVLRDFRGVRGRETSSPLPSDFEKCVVAAENDFGLVTVPQFFDEDLQGFITFAEWLGTVNLSDSKTRLSLMRATARGKVPIFERETERGLTTLNPKRLLEKVYLRSLPIFNMKKDGEQLYGEPVEGSRVLLIDDLKTPVPVLPGHKYCVLQTSAKNYQHFYVADRPLNGSERHLLQQILAVDHGGDSGATSGFQPHRMPGSINFKQGRRLFVTQLIKCSTDGVTIPVMLKLADIKANSGEEGCRVLYEPSSPSLQSQSNKDYAWVMRNLRETKKSRDQLISELNVPSLARGKHADYARLTVDNAMAAKAQLDSRRGR